MNRKFGSVLVATVVALTGALVILPSAVQAHPQLARTAWKEINGPWRISFAEGQRDGNTWSGSWKGSLHHDQKDHPNGVYVLTMNTETRGELVLYENNQLLCKATVHFEGTHHLKFGNAEYRREE
jgi:hypothetical protein